jgi:DNA ligase-1
MDINFTNWVMSEKLDGIRAYWNGTNLISRSGKVINAPKWFIKDYPPFAIDGELWSKRADFENISSIVRDKVPSNSWHQITHNIFEVPDKSRKLDLFQRLSKLKIYLKNHKNSHIKIIPQTKIKDKNHLQKFLKEIEAKQGEGVVIRDFTSYYIDKRTNKALKVKTFFDSECKIVGYTKYKGKVKTKSQTKVGAIKCQLLDGSNTLFKIGSGLSNEFRKNPPKIGTIITFKYKEFTKYGKPRFSSYLRIRKRD